MSLSPDTTFRDERKARETNPNRLVWVLSRARWEKGHPEEDFYWRGKYKDELVQVPPEGKKRVLMKYTAANRFLGQGDLPYRPYPNGSILHPETGKVEKDERGFTKRLGKPLYIQELTREEALEYDSLSVKDAMLKAKEIEKENASRKHSFDGQNTTALGMGKPQAQESPRHSVLDDIQRFE